MKIPIQRYGCFFTGSCDFRPLLLLIYFIVNQYFKIKMAHM